MWPILLLETLEMSHGFIGDASKLGGGEFWPALSQRSSQHVLLGTGAEWPRIYSMTFESRLFLSHLLLHPQLFLLSGQTSPPTTP